MKYELFQKGNTHFDYTIDTEKGMDGILIVDANGGEYIDEISLKDIFEEIEKLIEANVKAKKARSRE